MPSVFADIDAGDVDGEAAILTRAAGRLLQGIAVLHAALGLWSGRGPLAAIVRDGVLGAVDPFPDRRLAFWFLLASPVLWTLGRLIAWTSARGGPPGFLGRELLVMAAVCCALMPVSGSWLLLAPAALLLAASRNRR